MKPDEAENKGHQEPRPGYYLVTESRSRDSEDVTLLDLWNILWSQRLFLAGVIALVSTIAVVVSLLITPIYRADVVMAPASSTESSGLGAQLGGLAGLAGIRIGGDSDDRHALAILQSRAFAEAFIRDNNLMPVFYPDMWDATKQEWKDSDTKEQPSMFDAVKTFRDDIFSVRSDPTSGLVTIAIEWMDPDQAAAWVNKIANRINDETRQRAIAETEKNLSFLNKQLGEAPVVELKSAIARLIENEIKTDMLARVKEEFAFKIIDPGVVPGQRSRPHRSLIVIVSTFFGGTFAILLGFLRHNIREQIRARASARTEG